MNKTNKNQLKGEIKKELKEITKIEGVSLIYAYGSFVRYLKGKSQSYNDIDILVILDDLKVDDSQLVVIEEKLQNIKNESKLKLHFQPCKFLRQWWNAVLLGEPWILTSIKDSIPIHDKMKILSSIKKLIKEEKTYNKEERIESLIESSEVFERENRKILLDALSILSELVTEICQLFLMTQKKMILNKEKIFEEIKKVEELKKYAGAYKEVVDLESKKDRGFLSEFTAENLDYYLGEINELIKSVEKEIIKNS